MFQVNELLRQEISSIILSELSDPRIQLTTVTSVNTSADLHYAHVYIQFHGTAEERGHCLEGLEHAAGRMRHLLAGRVRMKYIPELHFAYDESLDYAAKIDRKLKELSVPGDSEQETEQE